MALKTKPLKEWFKTDNEPVIISGPCSAETEEQLLTTARQIASIPRVKIFRAGIWKPRTRPGGFQGVGEKGLRWMKTVSEETGLLTAIEVAQPRHIELALKYGIDILWVGARTVVNPFSVQELSDALAGVDIPVMVKNPVNPDIRLWIGALERLNHGGISRLIAIHRGFYYYKHDFYRNSPMWEIPIELKRLFPTLPVLCDPSHICGNRQYIYSVSQKALDLEMDGLMLESHYQPSEALTDSEQQLTPSELSDLLSKLVLRKQNGSIGLQSKLEELRKEIDKVDWAMLDIIAKRMNIVDNIGEYKKVNSITILQIKRWREIIRDRMETGRKMGLSEDFLIGLLELIHRESIQRQMDILNNPDIQEPEME